MDPNLAIKCLERGVDGVLFSGCHPGDCHYTSGNYFARRRIMMLRKLLEFGGLDPRRVQMSWVSASEGAKWAEVVTSMVTNLRELGPTTYGEMRRSSQSLGGGSAAGDKSGQMAGSGAGMSVQASG
jgi:coenzyme F420-reducing hydrogenase delta subunit